MPNAGNAATSNSVGGTWASGYKSSADRCAALNVHHRPTNRLEFPRVTPWKTRLALDAHCICMSFHKRLHPIPNLFVAYSRNATNAYLDARTHLARHASYPPPILPVLGIKFSSVIINFYTRIASRKYIKNTIPTRIVFFGIACFLGLSAKFAEKERKEGCACVCSRITWWYFGGGTTRTVYPLIIFPYREIRTHRSSSGCHEWERNEA